MLTRTVVQTTELILRVDKAVLTRYCMLTRTVVQTTELILRVDKAVLTRYCMLTRTVGHTGRLTLVKPIAVFTDSARILCTFLTRVERPAGGISDVFDT